MSTSDKVKKTEQRTTGTPAQPTAERAPGAPGPTSTPQKDNPYASVRPKEGERLVTLAEADAVQESLYARHKKVYPRQVSGFFADLRVLFIGLTLGIFYGLPWLNWGGRQAFLIDLPARKFNLFAWTFWPQDLIYLAAILIISALSLFLFTAVLGRVWCGFTCPQTVWTEMFLWIERKFEGDRMKQMKLAKLPWSNREKLLKSGGKQVSWVLFSLLTGFSFVGFFTPIRELAVATADFALGPWQTFWILFYGFATYGNAGFLREQVCTYMCPYARFQSAMFDPNTLIISYDQKRGEPRGARNRTIDPKSQGLGDCIDCTLCVQVCPTGIDIRKGLQYQCIACAACVDVCDSVMDKMGYPRGLIRYTTQNALEGKPSRLLRPRVMVYTAILTAISIALVTSVLMRVPLDLDVIRDRGSLYRETGEGLIENVYTLKVLNMDERPHSYTLNATGIPDLKLLQDNEIVIDGGRVQEVAVRLQADPGNLAKRSTEVTFELQAIDNPKLKVTEEARFLGPNTR